MGNKVEPAPVDHQIEFLDAELGGVVVDRRHLLGAGEDPGGGLDGGARRDRLLLAKEIGLVVDWLNRPACGEARLDRRGLRRNDRRAPVFVGEAEPPAVALEGFGPAGRLLDVLIGDLLYAAVADHADEAFVQHRIAADRRHAMAEHEGVGLHGRCRAAGVRDRIRDREHVFVVDRNDALEDQTRAIVPGQRHRLRWSERLPIGGPYRVETRRLCACRAYEAGLRPIGVRRASRREQPDIRALRIDGLVIILENNIVELATLEVDRAADAGRVDDHPGAGRQDLTDRPGGLPQWRPGGVAAARAPGGIAAGAPGGETVGAPVGCASVGEAVLA